MEELGTTDKTNNRKWADAFVQEEKPKETFPNWANLFTWLHTTQILKEHKIRKYDMSTFIVQWLLYTYILYT